MGDIELIWEVQYEWVLENVEEKDCLVIVDSFKNTFPKKLFVQAYVFPCDSLSLCYQTDNS